MARRSPMNARYQKNTAPAGKTRKSASAAKPKREAGGAAPEPAKKKSTFREAMAAQPNTPEMKRWRKIWFALIAAAFVVALVAGFAPFAKGNPTIAIASTVVYLACLGGAIYIDMAIIRRLRREAAEAAKSGKKK